MKAREIVDFVNCLDFPLPEAERFWKLGDATALRVDENGRYYRANYERGILLYALVAKYRPRAILEFGTGRGYGSLCMAWAMEDFKIAGRIYTIDFMSPDEVFEWPINWGEGPRVERLSRSQVWPKAAPITRLNRIEELTGFSGQAMNHWHGPKIELAFIDAGHNYNAVRHDFYSVLNVAADHFGILFDDYNPKAEFGVQHLIDKEVAPNFDAQLIYTDRRWPGGERAALVNPEYGMVWIQNDSLHKATGKVYPFKQTRNFLYWYRQREKLSALWHKLKKLLKKILIK